MNRINELQRCILEIFREFDRVCAKLNIRYFLVAGTLLGAIRHQGFIPWDDDVDVGMFRNDYERFLKEAPLCLKDYYFLQTYHSDPEWPANFAKIRDSRTTFIESTVKDRNMNHGLFMDIFPIDFYPTNCFKAQMLEKKNRMMARRLLQEFPSPQYKASIPHLIRKRAINMFDKIMFPTLSGLLDAREKLFKSVPVSDLTVNYCGAWGKREIMPREWYGNGVEVMFEGIKSRAPVEYDKYLTQLYGDYMQLPPHEKRVSHHYTEAIDVHKPYEVYRQSMNLK